MGITFIPMFALPFQSSNEIITSWAVNYEAELFEYHSEIGFSVAYGVLRPFLLYLFMERLLTILYPVYLIAGFILFFHGKKWAEDTAHIVAVIYLFLWTILLLCGCALFTPGVLEGFFYEVKGFWYYLIETALCTLIVLFVVGVRLREKYVEKKKRQT